LKALYAEWEQHPPLPLMVAAYMGLKPQDKGTPDEMMMQLGAMPGVKVETIKKTQGADVE
jgi:O-succinylbenzoate synthase